MPIVAKRSPISAIAELLFNYLEVTELRIVIYFDIKVF